MSEPTRHHYVPIFYLKRWAGADGRLCEYSCPYRQTKAKRKHPAATGYVDGLYTVPDLPPEQAQYVEKQFMQKIDDWAARAVAVMLRGDSKSSDIDARMKIGWARFLYSLIIRTPERLQIMQKQSNETSPLESIEKIRDDYSNLRGPDDPEKFDEYKERLSANPLKVPAQRILTTLLNSKRVILEIANMQWTTANVASAKHTMLTSDRPIIMSNGLSQWDAHIAIPLSPQCLFFAVKTDEMRRQITSMSRDQMVEVANNKVAEQAVRYVYGTDDRQLRFGANRLGKRVPSTPLG